MSASSSTTTASTTTQRSTSNRPTTPGLTVTVKTTTPAGTTTTTPKSMLQIVSNSQNALQSFSPPVESQKKPYGNNLFLNSLQYEVSNQGTQITEKTPAYDSVRPAKPQIVFPFSFFKPTSKSFKQFKLYVKRPQKKNERNQVPHWYPGKLPQLPPQCPPA